MQQISKIQDDIERLIKVQRYVDETKHFMTGSYIIYADPEMRRNIYLVLDAMVSEYGEYGDVEGKQFRIVLRLRPALLDRDDDDPGDGDDFQIGEEHLDNMRLVTRADLTRYLTSANAEARQIARKVYDTLSI